MASIDVPDKSLPAVNIVECLLETDDEEEFALGLNKHFHNLFDRIDAEYDDAMMALEEEETAELYHSWCREKWYSRPSLMPQLAGAV
jgi:hypothetical protein